MKKLFFLLLLLAFGFIGRSQSDATEAQVDAINQMSQDQVDNIRQQASSEATDRANIGAALDHLNTFLSIAQSAQDLYNSAHSLSNGECAPDFSTSANDMMPSSCSSADCQDCYAKAVKELTFVRRQLGRLSCIYRNTRNFNQSAIAFGDNASGIHAVTGLAWQNARAEIIAEYENFKKVYDDKYEGMMGSLEKALKAIGECENQYGGQRDWYQRFGFIYFQMMQDKYKRTD